MPVVEGSHTPPHIRKEQEAFLELQRDAHTSYEFRNSAQKCQRQNPLRTMKVHWCAFKENTHSVHRCYAYFRNPLMTCAVCVCLHTVLSNASGLLSSCSATALEMARSVSSCRCLESFVGDGCSMYSGSCWGTRWETGKPPRKKGTQTNRDKKKSLKDDQRARILGSLFRYFIQHYITN